MRSSHGLRATSLTLGCALLAACGSGAEPGPRGPTSDAATGGDSANVGAIDASATDGSASDSAASAEASAEAGASAAGDASPGDAQDTAVGPDAGFTPAAHSALPQVITFGGPVLTAPKVQPIAYQADTGASDLEAFLQELKTTTFWSQTTSEYGVGPLTILPAIVLASPPPMTITDATLQTDLANNTSGANPAWGAADQSTIYLFILPTDTGLSGASGTSCIDFDGYHDEAPTGSTSVPYAVTCACPGFDGPTVTDPQQRSVSVSHELVEAATDPLFETAPAYVQEADPEAIWTLVTGGEVADMCQFNTDSYFVPAGMTHMIQRSWSNAAASAGKNPCVPATAMNAFIDTFAATSAVSWSPPGAGTITSQGVSIPIGQDKTVPITLFSSAPTSGPWTVQAIDYNEFFNGGAANLTLSLDKSSGENGDTLQLTIHVNSNDAAIGGEAFLLFSTFGHPGDPSYETTSTAWLVTN